MIISVVILCIQLFFAIVIGLYFLNLLKSQQANRTAVEKTSKKEIEKLRKLRSISLSIPLAEKTRPSQLHEIIGQQEGIKALQAALCGANPQHVIIYGPPGVGKTAAARMILQEAKKCPESPFKRDAKFIEIDATTLRYDERGIADPLIGSVHDPIYQGAGAMGVAGIPQPKSGAVTKAHGGILFIDEIGELHSVQMNKLLKVLEDRKVYLESSYYHEEDKQIPLHIHDIFQNGLPADFRLIGATTRNQSEIPPAIRSRCIEIFFRPLYPEEIALIANQAATKIGFTHHDEAIQLLTHYATNGREAVNMVQLSTGIAWTERRQHITEQDIEWIAHRSQLTLRIVKKVPQTAQIGYVNGLAVFGNNQGTLLEIEVAAISSFKNKGKINITGIIEEEFIESTHRSLRQKSTAKGSLENVCTVLRKLGVKVTDYDLHINFPGVVPIDGPSAGISIACAIASAISRIPIDPQIAMTGELSIHGKIKPVGGVVTKIEVAIRAGVKKIVIPKENWQAVYTDFSDIEIVAVDQIEDVFQQLFGFERFQSNLASASFHPITTSNNEFI